MSLEPNSVLEGKYEIIRRLGSGGMGEVYLVKHLHLQTQRVIKILRPDLASDPVVAQRFHQEARTAIQISHPHVAVLYDFAQLGDGRFYMDWEYIEGEDVGARLRSGGPFPAATAVDLAIQSLRGLGAIHDAGVIHRDVSPDNLMISPGDKGRYKITIIDLGLAKDVTGEDAMQLTQAGTFLGKLQYCSPEQAGYKKGGELDRRSDLYSFSLVLYEMLAGLPPFDSDSQHGYVLKRLTEEPLPLRDRNPLVELPEEIEKVVMKGLEKDREKRFTDAHDFISALEAIRAVAEACPPPKKAPDPEDGADGLKTTKKVKTRPQELSKAERSELLAQIDQAAKKVQEGSKAFVMAEEALTGGRVEEARDFIDRLQKVSPRREGLAELKERLEEAEGAAQQQDRVRQAEELLERYLRDKQQALARLVLDTLLELHPNHPRREDYEAWVGLLGEEEEQQEIAEEALSAGRKAIVRGDLSAARGELAKIEKTDPGGDLSQSLSMDLEKALEEEQQAKELGDHRTRLDQLLAEGELDQAEKELEELAGLGITKVSLDHYRQQVQEARSRAELEAQVDELEDKFNECLSRQAWQDARQVARDLAEAFPESSRPGEMFSEIDRRDQAHRKDQSIAQGVSVIQHYLDEGRLAEAEMALKVLSQMDPHNASMPQFRRQLKKLQG